MNIKIKTKINNNYIRYSLMVFAILIDVSILAIVGNNVFLAIGFMLFNFVAIGLYCLKKTAVEVTILSIIFMLFFSLFVDICIHYLGLKVILETEFIYLFPLIIACAKTKRKSKSLFPVLCICYVVFNLLITLIGQKVDFYNYLLMMVNIVTFICFFYLFQNIQLSEKVRSLYVYLFVCSSVLTIFETIVGFHTDTRNGVFSVFGFGAYTIFIMIFIVYKISMFTFKEISIWQFILSIVFCASLYILTEAKAALVVMFINIVLISCVQRGVSARRLIIICFGILAVPISYNILLMFNPKFQYLNNLSTIIHYYTGNNNWRYQYGRFEAIANVFRERGLFEKFFGVGFGSSTPMYKVFFDELSRNVVYPYYIEKYGYKYGFQHTSTASLVLDGGLLLMGFVVVSLVNKIINTTTILYKHKSNIIGSIQFGIIIYLLYYFTYANLLKDFRAIAITAIILAIDPKNEFLSRMRENDE